ncbi:hypothetical protein [Helicobacter labetoulli]|uniref:hypothetical protein n=1 Tax=Helicobacter labetoulli TaxID=2315333 RepID=UPI000EF68912|nr:hypothetical protein [Helicobacter labetoulli]
MKNEFDYQKLALFISEAIVTALDERDLKKSRSALNNRGQCAEKTDFEVLDKTPLAVPMDCKVPESLDSILQRHIAVYMAKQSGQEGYDFDDDLSVLDDDFDDDDFQSKYEYPDVELGRNVTKGNISQVGEPKDAEIPIPADIEPTKDDVAKE